MDDRSKAGLCASCAHSRDVVSDRGSRFFLCARHKADPAYQKYPRLPTIFCLGYEKRDNGSQTPLDGNFGSE